MLEFLTEQTTTGKRLQDVANHGNGEIVLGKNKKESVTLARDDEFRDRFFLIVETEARFIIRVTIAGPDLKALASALRQAQEDLDEAD